MKQYWIAALFISVLVMLVVYTTLLSNNKTENTKLDTKHTEQCVDKVNQKLEELRKEFKEHESALVSELKSLNEKDKNEVIEKILKETKTRKYEEIEVDEELSLDELKKIELQFTNLTAPNTEYCFTAALPKNRRKVKKLIPVYQPISNINQLPEAEEIEEAFVAFVTPGGYVDLMKVVVEAVHEFSTRPIILYGFDLDTNPYEKDNFPRLKFVKAKGAVSSAYFNKIKSIILSRVKYGVLLEADSIPNWKIDDLFLIAKRHASGRLPLLPRHASDPHNQIPTMKSLKIPCKTLDYGHAHILFTYHNLQFLNEVHEQCIHGDYNGINWDESAINVNLWGNKARKQACTYDSDRGFLETYIKQAITTYGQHPKTKEMIDVLGKNPHLAEQYAPVTAPMGFLIVHGEKSPARAREILEELKKNRGKPVYSDGNIWTTDLDHPAIHGCIVETSPNEWPAMTP